MARGVEPRSAQRGQRPSVAVEDALPSGIMSIWARPISSRGPVSAEARSPTVTSNDPASRCAAAAARMRSPRCSGSTVSAAERSSMAAAAPRPPRGTHATGRMLQGERDVLVRSGRTERAVPGLPIRVQLRIGRGRECPMRRLAIPERGRVVRRGPHERMAEPDPYTELDQPGASIAGSASTARRRPTRSQRADRINGSPVGSAAATVRNRWVAGGSSEIRRRNASSI